MQTEFDQQGNPTTVRPKAVECEQQILSAMILWSEAAHVAHEMLREDDFYDPICRSVFRALMRMYERGEPLDDDLRLRAELEEMGRLDDVGGPSYLAALHDRWANAASIEWYCEQVVGAAIRRRLQDMHVAGLHGVNETSNWEVLIEEAEKEIYSIRSRVTKDTCENIGSISADLATDYDEVIAARLVNPLDGPRLVSTGMEDLDNLFGGGIRGGELVVLAARPSVGKTTLALNIARRWVVPERASGPTGSALIFSLEMRKSEVARSVLCAHGQIPLSLLQKYDLSPEEYDLLQRTRKEIAKARLWIEPGQASPEGIKSKIRQLHSRGDADLVVIDYLQLMSFSSRGRDYNRQQQVAEASRQFKLLAIELDIPVILVSQLNRESENRAGGRPRMSDLRESGAIEQDADKVLLLFQVEGATELTVIVAKNRFGATGQANLLFRKKCCRFDDPAKVIPEGLGFGDDDGRYGG